MKKTVCLLLAGLMTIGALTGCGSSADNKKDDSAKTETTGEKKSDGFDTSSDITVVSREDGSGTRGAFIELFGVQQEENGEKAQNASYTLIGTLKASMESLIVLKAEDTIEVERISVG